MINTEEFAKELMAEMNCETAFTLPVFGGIPIAESVVVTWIIMAALTILSICLVRNFTVENPSKKQLFFEVTIGGLYKFFEDTLGEHGKIYIPYMISTTLYLGAANTIGAFGIKPPTKDLNITIALAFMSIFLIEFAGIHQLGIKKWIKHFAEPMPLLAPINILEIIIRPLSLCMRLFGNILGGFIIMEMLKLVAPLFVPVVFSMYFDFFDGLIQTFVFVFLTSLFIKEATE